MSDRLPPENRPFTIQIKRRHFDHAICGAPRACVIARAVQDTFPDVENVTIGADDMAAGPDDDRRWWTHNGEAIVHAFDRGLLVGPGGLGLTVTFLPVPRNLTTPSPPPMGGYLYAKAI